MRIAPFGIARGRRQLVERVGRPRRTLGGIGHEDAVEARERLVHRLRARERDDRPHVGEVVRGAVEVADVLGRHGADARGLAALVVAERVPGAVHRMVERTPLLPGRIRHRGDHLVVDRALLLEAQGAVRVLRDAEVAHFQLDLGIAVIGVQHGALLLGEDVEEGVGAGGGVEEVAGAPGLGEGRVGDQRHRLARAQGAAANAAQQQQVLLGVRLALVPGRERVHPAERLRHRLHLHKVQGESGRAVHEARAERTVLVVEVDRLGPEAVRRVPGRELREVDRGGVGGGEQAEGCGGEQGNAHGGRSGRRWAG
jgi:hypothetical protein